MTLQALLAEVDPGWYAAQAADDAPDAGLITRAQDSALGRRLLARWLASDGASALLAPSPDRNPSAITAQWPRAQVAALVRDLGVLAYAPAIRAEVRRDPVRRLKHALGNSYLLALDQTVWDGRVDATLIARLSTEFGEALAADPKHDDRLYAMFDAQGRGELRAWAAKRATPRSATGPACCIRARRRAPRTCRKSRCCGCTPTTKRAPRPPPERRPEDACLPTLSQRTP